MKIAQQWILRSLEFASDAGDWQKPTIEHRMEYTVSQLQFIWEPCWMHLNQGLDIVQMLLLVPVDRENRKASLCSANRWDVKSLNNLGWYWSLQEAVYQLVDGWILLEWNRKMLFFYKFIALLLRRRMNHQGVIMQWTYRIWIPWNTLQWFPLFNSLHLWAIREVTGYREVVYVMGYAGSDTQWWRD